jgi:hypothetical protein
MEKEWVEPEELLRHIRDGKPKQIVLYMAHPANDEVGHRVEIIFGQVKYWTRFSVNMWTGGGIPDGFPILVGEAEWEERAMPFYRCRAIIANPNLLLNRSS